jgi:hypothetical protein
VSDAFSRRMKGSEGRTIARERPECYGDPDTYDDDDDDCQECPAQASCLNIVKRKDRLAAQNVQVSRSRIPNPRTTLSSNRGPPASTALSRRKKDEVAVAELMVAPDSKREEPYDDDTWLDAFRMNAFLGTAQTLVDELGHGIRSIPRVKYPNPFVDKE